jgi:hypothetical protein
MLNRNAVLSIESDSDYESYATENNTDFNASDDYDSDSIDEEKSDSEMSFIEKLQLLHDNGKNVTFSKHVNHINNTFEILNHLQKVRQFLFPLDKRMKLEFTEFLSGIDIGLSPECLSATYRIISAVGEYEYWALKCELTKIIFILITNECMKIFSEFIAFNFLSSHLNA